LENRAVRRLGSTRAEPVDVALIAATGVDLKHAVSDGSFRTDLYHRLAVISLELPPLRARGAAILALGEYFLAPACAGYDLPARSLTADGRDLMLAYPWPGNVRELANAMERVVLLSNTEAITAEMLEFLASAATPAGDAIEAGDVTDTATGGSLDTALRA